MMRWAWAVAAVASPLPASAAGDPVALGGLVALSGFVALGAAGLVALGLAWRAQRRHALLAARLRALLHIDDAAGDAPADIAVGVARLQDELATARRALQEQSEQRQRAEAALRESEERYALAVRGANDGLWEWNVRSGTMYLSPRWRAMLGFGEDDFAPTAQAWKARIHPDDLVRVEGALRSHVDGFTPRFESEHRVLHKDGSRRWVLSRGSAIRHASGSAYRMIGLDTDITQFKRMEEIMLLLAEGTSGKTGEAFFRSMVKNFAAVLGVRIAFVTRCLDYPATRVRALAFFDRGEFRDDVEYDLAGTPCETVIRDGTACFHPTALARRFPIEAGLDSYYGVPIADDDGRVVGHLAFMDEKQMNEGVVLDSIYRIFTARAAAELSRQEVERTVADLVTGLAHASGEEGMRALVRGFARVMGAREAFVTECGDGADPQVHVLAWWRDGHFEGERTYALSGSVCEETVREGKVCFYPRGVGERFPRAKPLGREAYVGVPCKDAGGRVIGHIACCSDRPVVRDLPDQAILQLFAGRASIELERRGLSRRVELPGVRALS
jgi:PAS domain S-box-containing protein